MKLRYGDDMFIEVHFWSFVKCTILAQLTIAALVYGTLFLVGFIAVMFGW